MDDTSKQFDLTTGGILQKLLVIAAPVIGMQLFQMIYNLADMFWMGKLGTDALAATASSGMYLWLSMGLLVLGRMGAEIGVSQAFGAGDTEAAHRYMTNSFLLSVVFGTVVGLAMTIFRGPLVGFFNIREAEVVSLSELYLGISGIGVPMMYVAAVVSGAFTGAGNSRLVFYINAIGIVFNLVLDPIMIFALDMGIIGAALSNVLGQLLGLVLSLIALYRHKSRPFAKAALWKKPSWDVMKQIWIWGLPVVLESLLFPFLSMLNTRMLTQWGAEALAAQRIASQAESLSWLIAGGFCMAVTSFIGQNYGAGKWTRIHRGMRISAGMLAVYGVLITAALFFLGEPIFRVFTDDEVVIAIGVRFLQILAACQFVACFEPLCAGCFRGIGRTTPPSVISITCNALRVPLAFFLSRTGLGVYGIMWGIVFGAIARAALLMLVYAIQSRKLPKTDRVVV